MAKISLLPALNNPDGTELVPVVKGGKTMRASVAGLVAGAVADTVDNLKVDAVAYIGRPGDAALVDGTPTGIGAIYWHDAVDDTGSLIAIDVFDRAAGTINLAAYRGPLGALARSALTSVKTTGTRTSRRIMLAEPIPVRAGDILAVQPTDGALTVAELQSGDVGYTYSAPYLPETVALGAPTTNGQVQVRFVIAYRKQIVTADTFLAATGVKIIGPRAVALSGDVNPRGFLEWKTTGQPTAHTVRWGNYTVNLDGQTQRMEFPNNSLALPYAFIGNSLTDSTDVANRWSQLLAARYNQLMISVARYSSDWRMVYRVGAKAIVLTLAGTLPANGTVAVSKINGAAIDGNNPAAFLTTGDASVVSGMATSGYLTRNGVTRRATVSAPNGASFAYVVRQEAGQTAMTFDGPVTFVPDFALSVPGRICPIWIGNNYFFSGVANAYGDYTNPQMWVDLKLIVAFLQARGCRVILIPIIPSANTAEGDNWLARGPGTPYTAMESANARTEAMFPGLMARHTDGRTFLKFLQDRNDGSPEALDDVAKGFTPRNLRRRADGSYDLLHMYGDGAGDRAVADFVDSALQAQVLPAAITQTTDFVITAIGSADQVPDVAVARVGRDMLANVVDQSVSNAARLDVSLALPANNSNPNLYSDPELEYLSVGDVQAWGASNMTVVSTAGAKRLRTPSSTAPLAIIDSAARMLPVTAFANGRVSASIIIAAKAATTVGALRVRLYALDAAGQTVAWPDQSAADEQASLYYTRFVPTAAIASPTELVIAQGVAIPPAAVTIGFFYRIETAVQMDISHHTLRNGSDPHYRAPAMSARKLSDAGNNSTSALAIATSLQTTASIGSANLYPNLYPDPDLDYYAAGDTVQWQNSTFLVVNGASGKRLRTPAVSTAVGIIDAPSRRIMVSGIPSGIVSASVIIDRKDVTAAPTDIRVRLYAYDAAGAQLYWAAGIGSDEVGTNYYSRFVPVAAITAPTELVVARGVPLPAGTAWLAWGVRVDTTVTMDFGALTLRNGLDPHYQPPRVTAKQVADANANATAALAAVPKEDAASYAVAFPNRFLASELDVAGVLRVGSGSVNLPVASSYGTEARPVWAVVAPAGGTAEYGVFIGNIPRADLVHASGKFSMAIQVYDLATYVGPRVAAQQTARILIVQRNAANGEIANTRITKSLPTGMAPQQWVREPGITLHADTAFVLIYIGVVNLEGTTSRTLLFNEMLLAPGLNATFRRPPLVASTMSAGGGVMFVGPNGVDTAAGSLAAPMATGQAAINKMGGAGSVIYLPGTYTTAQRISPASVTGKVRLYGKRAAGVAYDTFPVINLGNKVTGIAKTAGFTKVYQAAVAGMPTLENFNWAYQDGVADPRTVIAPADRSPQHRGRTNRLHWATKLVKTTATALDAAKAEIEAADPNDPRAFIDEATGTFYFSIVGGGDATVAPIYFDAAIGLFSGAGRESCGEIEIENLEVRYGGLDTSAFRHAHINETFIFGSAQNCLYYSNLTFGTLECAAAGSQAGLVGDGLNGHIGAKIPSGSDYYGHDCRDDGYSDHEGNSSRLHGGLVEYNGGTGMAPAYGADDVILNFISRRNQQRGTYKKAGFYVTGGPATTPATGDGGVDTLAIFRNCISIGDIVGFADDRASTANAVRAITIDCKVYDNTGPYGFDVAEMRDCGWSSATGVARRTNGGATLVKNTTLVT
jgi:hypothetical protein